jgi:hypothetical protein
LVVLNERHLVALRNKTKENDITAAKMWLRKVSN